MCACSDLTWVHNAVINMHARRREPDLAFAVANEIGPRKDSWSYSGLLNACAKVWVPKLYTAPLLIGAFPGEVDSII